MIREHMKVEIEGVGTFVVPMPIIELLEQYAKRVVEKDAQIAMLRQACMDARRWITHHDDGEGEGPAYELSTIRKALERSAEATP